MTIYPLPSNEKRKASHLPPWQDGEIKPSNNGLYLRDFDAGIATTEFHDGECLREDFFPSDIQDARWRGPRSPAN